MESVQPVSIASAKSFVLSEEAANYLTHGAGLVLSLAGVRHLLTEAAGHGSWRQVAGLGVFGGAMALVYLASTVYHAAEHAGWKRMLRVCDHAAIYLMIAGTYTPFLLSLSAPWRTWGLVGVWTLAAAGVVFKLVMGVRFDRLSVAIYLLMGWIGVLLIGPLVGRITAHGVGWLVAGGLAYSVGTLFYVRSDMRYGHAVWHLFVLLGSALHFWAVAAYVVPLTFA